MIHCPTFRRDLETLYRRLHQGQTVEPVSTVLLLAILASMGSYWGLGESEVQWFASGFVAAKVGVLW